MKRKKSLTFEVYSKIKQLMFNYEIVPGQRLVFTDLAAQLQVSRTPVNNALSILAQEGYLDFIPNQGYSVHKLTLKEARDLYEIRDILESGFIGEAIRKLTPAGLRQIEQCKLKYEKAVTNRVKRNLFILDADYHVSILSMAKNRHLIERYQSISQQIYLRITLEGLMVSRIHEIEEEHNRVFEAVSNRDVEAAKRAILDHHANSRSSLWPIIFPEHVSGLH